MLDFNPEKPLVMHIDINSCFATIEQQANPLLRRKPVAVCAYDSPRGCILAASIEAKRFGVKTGMRIKDGKALCPFLIILTPDPPKYRDVHIKMSSILKSYTNHLSPKSIDEFVLHFEGLPILSKMNMSEIGREIKQRIRDEIGEWISVSVGIGPSRFMAKTAAGFQKPDGLVEIDKNNFLEIYSKLSLTDLHGIASRNEARLKSVGIKSVFDFYTAPLWKLRAAFHSIAANFWHMRLRGYEIDDVSWQRKSFGNTYSLKKQVFVGKELDPVLSKLVEKASFRLRGAGFVAEGIHVAVLFSNYTFWHKGLSFSRKFSDARDIYKAAHFILKDAPHGILVRNLAVSCFSLSKNTSLQLELFSDTVKKADLVKSLDAVNKRWGDFVVHSGRMIDTQKFVPDAIAFGNVKEISNA